VHGSGPPLLVDACWLSHLQFDWQSPVWRHYLVELGRIATVGLQGRTARTAAVAKLLSRA
jgi:hypothetical protein